MMRKFAALAFVVIASAEATSFDMLTDLIPGSSEYSKHEYDSVIDDFRNTAESNIRTNLEW